MCLSLFSLASLFLSLSLARASGPPIVRPRIFERPLFPRKRRGLRESAERASSLPVSGKQWRRKNSTMFFFPPSRDDRAKAPPSPRARECPLRKNFDQSFSLRDPSKTVQASRRSGEARESESEPRRSLQQFQKEAGCKTEASERATKEKKEKKREKERKSKKSAPRSARLLPRFVSIFRFQGKERSLVRTLERRAGQKARGLAWGSGANAANKAQKK